MSIDLASYINSDNSVSTEKLQAVAARIQGVLLRDWVDIDYTPSSVFGNLFITPAAKAIALFEDAADCLLTDVDLTNALNGIVCNCDFLQSFLKGLGVASLTDINVSGMVRLKFVSDVSDDNPITFDSGEILLFKDTYIFNYFTPFSGDIKIYGTNYKIDANTNSNIFKLSAYNIVEDSTNGNFTANEFFVDIPVYGPSAALVEAGSEAKIDESLKAKYETVWESVEMLYDVQPFEAPTNIAELIQLTRKIQPSSNFATRGNIVSCVYQKFPTCIGCSPVIPGDEECKRSSSVLGSTMPIVDIYIKGSYDLIECTEYIKPVYNDGALYWEFNTAHTPLYIKQLYINNTPSYLDITIDKDANLLRNVANTSPSNLMCNNTFYFDLPDFQSNSYIGITYLFDPVAESVNTWVKSPDCQPALDVKVVPNVPVIIKSLSINYTKSVNKFFNRQEAIDQIYKLVNSLSYPVNWNESYIAEIMTACGASSVGDINLSCGCYIQSAGIKRYVDINDIPPELGIGKRNIAYILFRDKIELHEILIK